MAEKLTEKGLVVGLIVEAEKKIVEKKAAEQRSAAAEGAKKRASRGKAEE